MSRPRIGELVLEAGLVSSAEVDDALVEHGRSGKRLGAVLVERGYLEESQLTALLSKQLSVPWVSLSHLDPEGRLLQLVPLDVARKHGAVPLFVRKVRHRGETLCIAVDDPTNDATISAVAERASMPVTVMIASPSEIRAAIRLMYGVADEESARPTGPRAPSLDHPDDEPVIESEVFEFPVQRGVVALTFLDGTTLSVPSRSSRPPANGEDVERARAAIDSLRRMVPTAHEKPWEPVMAAIVASLMQRGLVSERELGQELEAVLGRKPKQT